MKKMGSLLYDDPPRVISPTLAGLIGERAALLLQQFPFLTSGSRTDREKFKEGKWWTYDSFPDLRKKYFPWWSERKIQSVVASLVEKELLVIGHFAHHPSDRRNWYAVDHAKLESLVEENVVVDDAGFIEIIDPKKSTSTTQKVRDGSRKNCEVTSRKNSEIITIDKDYGTEIPQDLPRAAGPGENWDKDLDDQVTLPDDEEETIEEVVYEYIDDDGNPTSSAGATLRSPKWRQPTKHKLCQSAFAATNRQYFKSQGERYNWIKIEKSIMPLDAHGKVKYPTEWVERIIEWANAKNVAYQTANVTRVTQISFPALMSAICNKVSRKDWINMELQTRRKAGTVGSWDNDSDDDGSDDAWDTEQEDT